VLFCRVLDATGNLIEVFPGPVDECRFILGVVSRELTRGRNWTGLRGRPCDQSGSLLERSLGILTGVRSKLAKTKYRNKTVARDAWRVTLQIKPLFSSFTSCLGPAVWDWPLPWSNRLAYICSSVTGPRQDLGAGLALYSQSWMFILNEWVVLHTSLRYDFEEDHWKSYDSFIFTCSLVRSFLSVFLSPIYKQNLLEFYRRHLLGRWLLHDVRKQN
jgi:hypothetical protein